ncbi:MAG: circadian clock protein KaiA [Spirulinaceae cyanobacterium]
MSDYPLNLDPISQNTFTSQLALCVGVETQSLAETLQTQLQDYNTTLISSPRELAAIITKEKQQIDCLVLETQPSFLKILAELRQDGLLLPVVILEPEENTPNNTPESFVYHAGEVRQKRDRLEKLSLAIEHAISQFLQLTPPTTHPSPSHQDPQNTNFLLLQQRRLSEKLKERLGYLGVYYKRNPQDFFRHLSLQEQQKLFENLSQEYREIILNYFTDNENINPLIDQFVNRAFFADISVSQILEIHMELIDDFSQQLKIEGRSEEILLDYRLALIDIIAHLCEMYRRSIPREDLFLERYSQ